MPPLNAFSCLRVAPLLATIRGIHRSFEVRVKKALSQRGFTLIEVMLGVALLSICVMGASSGFDILSKGQRKIATSSELRDLMNEMKAIFYSEKACTAALKPLLLKPGTLPFDPDSTAPTMSLPRVNTDLTLGGTLVGPGMTYGPLKILSAKLYRKQKLSLTHYLLGYAIIVDRGPNSFGARVLPASIDFSALVDGSGTLVECAAPDASDKVDYVENVVCALGDDYVWDPNLKMCVYKYILHKIAGTSGASPACPGSWIPLSNPTCEVTGAGTYGSGSCATNSFGSTTVSTCFSFAHLEFDPTTQTCKCYYASNYTMTGSELCTIHCGEPKVF
jgi:prepilin-type N-terminal cleavage/methylation domain-containing protein